MTERLHSMMKEFWSGLGAAFTVKFWCKVSLLSQKCLVEGMFTRICLSWRGKHDWTCARIRLLCPWEVVVVDINALSVVPVSASTAVAAGMQHSCTALVWYQSCSINCLTAWVLMGKLRLFPVSSHHSSKSTSPLWTWAGTFCGFCAIITDF